MTITAPVTQSRRRSAAASELIVLAHRSDLMVQGMAGAIREAFKTCVYTRWQYLVSELERGLAASASVIVLEDRMTEQLTALEQVSYLHRAAPEVKLLIVSNFFDNVYVLCMIDAGAAGYLCAADPLNVLLPDAIRTVLKGRGYFSPAISSELFTEIQRDSYNLLDSRAREALALMISECSVFETAQRMGLSISQVYRLYTRLRQYFDVPTNEELVRRAIILGAL